MTISTMLLMKLILIKDFYIIYIYISLYKFICNFIEFLRVFKINILYDKRNKSNQHF